MSKKQKTTTKTTTATTARSKAKSATTVKQPTPTKRATRTTAAAAAGSAAASMDARLPPAGTSIQKIDRHGAVRCECQVKENGILYKGTLYRSISAAAMAAAKDLGLTNKTQNGFSFWGLVKPGSRSADPMEALERAWLRYHGTVAALVKRVTDEHRAQALATLHTHAQAVKALHDQVA